MIVVVLVSVATVGLVAALMIALGRAAVELRLPRAPVTARIGPLPLRRVVPEPARVQAEPEPATPEPALLYPDDVERVVRERLYGSRPSLR